MNPMKMLVAGATILLAACAGLVSAQTPRATKVMVDQDDVWIDQEPIIVRSKGTMIVWEIATEGYEFPKDGVVFKSGGAQFTCESLGKIFRCVDAYQQKGRFKYIIKVQPVKGSNVPKAAPLDPTVMND